MGAVATVPSGQDIPAPRSRGVLDFLGRGPVASAREEVHVREIGAVVNLRTNQAGCFVLDLADAANEMPRRPSQG